MSKQFTTSWYMDRQAQERAKQHADAVVDGVVAKAEDKGREVDLHNKIIKHCRDRGWIYFHGSTAQRTLRTVGEPDFTILADNSRVFFIECKTATGKLSTEQLGLAMWAEKLGHKIHVIRSEEAFLELIK